MRILCLSGWFPYPPDVGARARLFFLLREIGRAHAVDLLCFSHADETVSESALPPGISLLGAVPAPTERRRRLSPGALLSPYPRAIPEQYTPEMAARLETALTAGDYDLVLAFEIGPGVTVAPYLFQARNVARAVEDLEVSMIQAKVQAARSPLARFRYRQTWRKQRRYTRELLGHIHGCTVASETERRALTDIAPNGPPIAVVPNGLDLERYRGDFGPVERDTIVFPGALTYEANREAMRSFLREVFPRIRRARPTATLYITGRTDGVDLRALPLGEGVVLTGYLPDVRPRIARSVVCVAPLTLGGGTRIKILEAMALGTPVVATSKGAEGLEVTPGQDIIIADDPAHFAAEVVRLLENEELRATISAAGRRTVEQYDWQTIGQRLTSFLENDVRPQKRTVGATLVVAPVGARRRRAPTAAPCPYSRNQEEQR